VFLQRAYKIGEQLIDLSPKLFIDSSRFWTSEQLEFWLTVCQVAIFALKVSQAFGDNFPYL
jgi:hypothetical protein